MSEVWDGKERRIGERRKSELIPPPYSKEHGELLKNKIIEIANQFDVDIDYVASVVEEMRK